MMRFIATTLLLAGAASAKVILDFGSEWKWEASGTDLGSAWTGLNYNDAGWNSGPAQLGFGDGDEATKITGSTTQVYFRHTLTLSPAEGFISVVAKVVRDDGVICYLNGVEIGRDNMPEGSAYGTPAIEALSGDQESTPVTMNVGDGNLITGSNIIACSVHNQSPGSSDISFDFSLEGTVAPSPSAPPLTTFDETVIGQTTGPWKYEDSGTSLTGTAWTTLGYDDSTWGSSNAILGYGDGQPGAIAQNGVTAYFRRVFTVDNIARVEFGKISLLRDDGAICYVNGAEILRDNMPTGAITHDTLASAGVGNADETRYSADTKFDRSVMQTGNNLLACEVHQVTATSSDLSFDAIIKLGLTIDFAEPSPSGSNTPQPSPSRSPAASPVAASASPAPSPSPAGSGGGSDPSSTPAASPSPAGSGGGDVSASPTPSRSPIADGGICECSCACLSSCAAGDPLISACGGSGGDSGGGSSVGVAIGVVAAVLVVGGLAVGGFLWHKKNNQKKADAGAKAPSDQANPMLLTDGPADVEAGGKARSSRSRRERDGKDKERSSKDKERSSKDKERSSRSRRSEKDKEGGEKDEKRRSRSSRHKDGEKDEKRRSRSSRHKDGEERSERKSRSDRDKDGEKRHRSSSRRHKEGEERSSSRKERSSSKRPEGERSSRRSRSPRKTRE